MKKLAIVLAALLLACVFVGCSVLTEEALLGKWKQNDTSGDYVIWTFNEDKTLGYDYYEYNKSTKDWSKRTDWSGTGKWVVTGNILTITELGGIVGEYKVEVGNELKLYKGDAEEPTIILEKYTEDAE